MTDSDLKEIDDKIPPDLAALLQAEREWFRDFYQRTLTGLPDAAYRDYH